MASTVDDSSTLPTAARSHADARPDRVASPKPAATLVAPTAVSSAKQPSPGPPAKPQPKSSTVVKKEEPSAIDSAQNESEAETEILSDAAPDVPPRRKRAVKVEDRSDGDDDDDDDEEEEETRSRGAGGNSSRRNGLVNGTTNGTKNERPRRKSTSTALSTSPHSSGAPSSRHETARRSPSSAQASPKSPSHNRGRSLSTAVDSRKRKARDEPPARHHAEPPRQRPRTEATRDSPNLRNPPASPATATASATTATTPAAPTPSNAAAAAAVKPHRRSASTQSTLPPGQARRKREPVNLVLQPQKRDAWHSGSSSDGDSSPRPPPSAAPSHHHPLKRTSHRSLTSPARAMAHDKKRTDRFGATKLAREAERGELVAVKAAYSENPDELDQPDFAGIAPLQKAALNGHVDVVEFLIERGCKTDCQSDNRDTPLIDAAENGHLDVIKVLLTKGKVNPHHQNKKGERALDLLPSDDEEHEQMAQVLKEAMIRMSDTGSQKDGPPTSAKAEPSGLLYNEYNTETLKAKAAEGDMQLVGELLASNVKPNIQCGVAAARAGHHEILSLFLAEGLKPDPDPSKHPDTPMTVAIGRGHLKVIELLLGQDNFDPTRRNKDGKAYYELAEERRGPKWEQERGLLKAAFDELSSKRQKNSPRRERKQAHATSASAALQAKQKLARKSSPRPSERSSSPSRVAADGKRQVPRKTATGSSGLDPPPSKSRRLLTAKEMSTHRDAAAAVKRRRRVVVDDDEDDNNNHRGNNDDGSSSESVVQERRPRKKPRAASEGEDAKPVTKKRSAKSRLEAHEKPRKLRTSSPAAHSEESGGERRKPILKKPSSAKPRSVDPPKARAVQPTPETSSDADAKSHHKRLKKSPKSLTASALSTVTTTKIKSEPGPTSPSESTKPAQPSPTDTSKSVAQPSPRPPSETSAPSPTSQPPPPPVPEVPPRTPTPVREERLAEARRKEEEERIAAEKKRQEEERARRAAEKARLAAERLERLSKLPPALRKACEKGMDRPLCFDGDELGVTYSFFPLHLFPLSDVDPAAFASLPADDPTRRREFVISFQIVGVLGLPELDITKSFPEWERKDVTKEQWEIFLQQYDVAPIAQDTRFPMEGTKFWNDQDIQERLKDTREKMQALSPVYWIPYDVFEKEIKEGAFPLEKPALAKDDKDAAADASTAPGTEKVEFDDIEEQSPEEPQAQKLRSEREKRVRDLLRAYPIDTKRYIKIRKEPAQINGDGMIKKKSFLDLVMNKP